MMLVSLLRCSNDPWFGSVFWKVYLLGVRITNALVVSVFDATYFEQLEALRF